MQYEKKSRRLKHGILPSRRFIDPTHPHHSPPEASCNCREPALAHLRQEQFVLSRESLIIPPYFANHAVCADTIGAFGFVFGKTAEGYICETSLCVQRRKDTPLMIAVVAHEMHAWEVQLVVAHRASCYMEDTRSIWIGQLLDLFELQGCFVAIRLDKVSVLVLI